MRRRFTICLVALLISHALACRSDDLTPVVGCESIGDFEVDCQFRNPEDLAPSRDGRILISQFGAMDGTSAGTLAAYDPDTRALETLFPNDDVMVRSWGDPDCDPPDASRFSPHGLDIQRLAQGVHQLAVVNHGGRESVELFEVDAQSQLIWRGCVVAPEGGFLNDVVITADGGFWVTHMFEFGSGMKSFALAMLGFETGWVYAWSPDKGFSKLPGSDAPFPNGLEKSDDERYVYINTYASTGVRKVDVKTGERVAETEMASVDNSTWAEDGRLLVASHTASLSQMSACQELETGACGMPFEILSLDPDDLSARLVLRGEGPPMGGVTVALEVDGALYLGSFAGDRIGRVRLSDANGADDDAK